jgi:hypothetical protein
MATTTNFGWETPDDTDLVKDGALAIRTLGSAIDTSLVDLKGGTTGQVLSKTSNTDMDFTWVTSDDANAIQNAIVDAKGDLITATAADTPARLAVGTNGQILTADSTTATGLKWASAANAFVGASAARSASFTVSVNTSTAISFNTTDQFDTDAIHDTVTNPTRFTIPSGKGGKWLCNISPMISGGTPGGAVRTLIYINGTAKRRGTLGYISGNGETEFPLTEIMDLAAGDYIEFYVWQNFQTTATFYCGTNPTGEKQGTAQVVYLGA